jgi:hypothetical protein
MDLLEEVEKKNLDGGLEWKILKVPLQFPPLQSALSQNMYLCHTR